jgi:hypothetical protein
MFIQNEMWIGKPSGKTVQGLVEKGDEAVHTEIRYCIKSFLLE